MKTRITKDSGGMYVGEVYGTWKYQILGYEVSSWTGWSKVTARCMTRFGAKLELEQWKRKHFPEEFEI